MLDAYIIVDAGEAFGIRRSAASRARAASVLFEAVPEPRNPGSSPAPVPQAPGFDACISPTNVALLDALQIRAALPFQGSVANLKN